MSDLKAKMHQIRFRPGLCLSLLDPVGGAYSAPQPPSCDTILLRGEGRRGRKRRGEEKTKREDGRNAFPHLFNPTLTTERGDQCMHVTVTRI